MVLVADVYTGLGDTDEACFFCPGDDAEPYGLPGFWSRRCTRASGTPTRLACENGAVKATTKKNLTRVVAFFSEVVSFDYSPSLAILALETAEATSCIG